MKKITRRRFLQTTAFLGGTVLYHSSILKTLSEARLLQPALAEGLWTYPLAEPKRNIFTTCLQCHINCHLKARILDGVVVKIDGNPYSSQNLLPNINYKASLKEGARIDGKICPRGQAGIQTLYDPFRIRKVLKRDGPRGSGRWKTITFDKAIDEIVNGGKLFASIGEERNVPGLKDSFVLKDAKLAKSMSDDIAKIKKKEITVAQFKDKYKDKLDFLIDPEHPDLGPKNNQFVFLAGRIEHGRSEFAKRWLKDAFGSANFFEHTTICEQSHHIAYKYLTAQYMVEDGKGKWEEGKTHMKPDILNSEFIIFFGTGAFEANFGVTPMAEKVTDSLVERNLRYAVIDPRLSKTAAKARWWVPIKPGADGAFALGMIRWIIENNQYDQRYLENANKAAAEADGEPTCSNACYLIKIDKGLPGKSLRANEIGIGAESQFVVSRGGALIAVDPNDEAESVEGDLLVNTVINGIPVKSAFLLLKEEALSKTIEEYARICGVDKDIIKELAQEFVSHGKKAVAELYRGAVQHTNGYYNAQSIIALNFLIGNLGWKGGLSKGGGHWHDLGDEPGQPYDLAKMHPNKLSAFGVPITKEGWKYEESTLFSGYPAKRPWYPFTANVYQEVLPAIDDGYPYPTKVLFNHKGTPAYATPAGHRFIEILKDPEKIPLLISCDILIGETTMYADYVFPDLTYLERWGFPHAVPDVQSKISPVRQPAVSPIPEIVNIDGESMPISMEAIMIAIAKKLGLSGFGKDAFGPGVSLNRPEDYYLKRVANLSFGDEPGDAVPEADEEEMKLFRSARRHLSKSVFDEERWRKAVREDLWRKVVFVLNRGGRFEAFEKAYEGNYLAHKFTGMVRLYVEEVATTKNSMTGTNFSGLPKYESPREALGREIKSNGYEFQLITYKEIFHTQSRTPGNYWSLLIQPENRIWLNRRDAEKLGIGKDDVIKLVSATNPRGVFELGNGKKVEVKGKVDIVEGVRPGVVVVSHHYGHWAYGSNDIEVDGKKIQGDARRRAGLSPNSLMLIDRSLKNVCLTDPIGGSASFYDTWVKLVKV